MILEGIVTTVSPSGKINIAPMGPIVDEAMQHLVFRPFPTAQTYQNLRHRPEGVLHVTDDVLMLAMAAVGDVLPLPPMTAACMVEGYVITGCCRFYEFRCTKFDDSSERVRIGADVVNSGRFRDFFGFNRAKHAVVEAAILATRAHLLPREEIETEYRKLAVIVAKTGGPQEKAAFEFLDSRLRLSNHHEQNRNPH